jgi:hypothetical protein
MNIYQAQPQDVDTILPLYLAYRRFYQVEENLQIVKQPDALHFQRAEQGIELGKAHRFAVHFCEENEYEYLSSPAPGCRYHPAAVSRLSTFLSGRRKSRPGAG